MAIMLFRKLNKAEQKVEKTAERLQYWVDRIPDKDMAHYVAITGEIENGNL